MSDLFDAVTTVISNMATSLGTVSNTLLSNSIFQIVVGVVIFGICMGYVFTLVRKLKRKGR